MKLKVVGTSPNYLLISRRNNHGKGLSIYGRLNSGPPEMPTSELPEPINALKTEKKTLQMESS